LVLPDANALHGRVLRQEGTPLEGVELTVRHVGDHVARSTFSGADGAFRFDGAPLGRTEVMAFLAGCQLAIVEHEVVAGAGAPLVLRLAPARGRMLRFRIRGATPEQLAGTRCLFFGESGTALPESCRRGRPDAAGVWDVRGLPVDRTFHSLQAVVPGARCEPDAVICRPHPADGMYEFVFDTHTKCERELRGRILLPDGSPLAGAVVDKSANEVDQWAKTTTDAAGRFTARTTAPDGAIVGLRLDGAAHVLDGPGLLDYVSPKHRDTFLVRMPCPDELRLTALPAAAVRVHCRRHDGAPAAGAFVCVWIAWRTPQDRVFDSQLATGTTDDAGCVTFAGLHPELGGPVHVTAAGEGWASRSADVLLRGGDVVDVDVTAPPTGGLAGVARDGAGRPRAGEPIGVFAATSRHPEHACTVVTTSGDGRFRFEALGVGSYRFGPGHWDRGAGWRSEPFTIVAGETLVHDVVVPG
jgi:hypothetical protein